MSERFVLIGHPVGHSISPAIHSEAYRLLGRRASYELVDCLDVEAVSAVIGRIRRGELSGANVTVPWKQVAFDLAEVHDVSAKEVGVANVLARNTEGQIVAYNTDALAVGTELSLAVEKSGVDRENRPGALVLGSGGAALAAVVGCRLSGAESIAVTARRFVPGTDPASWPHAAQFRRLGVELLPWPIAGNEAVAHYLEASHLLVQATSAGMKGTTGGDELVEIVPWSALERCVAYDLIYVPASTCFLRRAEREGHYALGGLGMLVGQAVHSIKIWLGEAPDPSQLMGVAREALGQ